MAATTHPTLAAQREPKPKRKAKPAPDPVEYRGKLTKTGNSQAFRFESALFRSHPEFLTNVHARVIAPGQLLITADEPKEVELGEEEQEDPTLIAFLALLDRDIAQNPQHLQPLDEAQMLRIKELTKDVVIDPNEDFGDEDFFA